MVDPVPALHSGVGTRTRALFAAAHGALAGIDDRFDTS
jgi:hypothetical protein